MSQETPFAFGTLDARAGAENSKNPPDRISLRDHVVEVEIGAFQVERGTTQHVSFDIVVEVAPPATPLADDVDRILSYEMLVEAIAHELAAERLNLLETLAERIADRILHAPQAMRIFLRIQKLDLGPGALGVEIVRSKDKGYSGTPVPAADAAPHPTVVFLSNNAVASERLPFWLDQLQSVGSPVILCVGPADIEVPVSSVGAAQRRIDLLAIEQNAWVLAGRDARCLVVDTRAEFEWAARKQRISVWAPSKIVLDAVAGPTVTLGDYMSLVGWFAQELEAEKLLVIDAPITDSGALPVSAISLDQNII